MTALSDRSHLEWGRLKDLLQGDELELKRHNSHRLPIGLRADMHTGLRMHAFNVGRSDPGRPSMFIIFFACSFCTSTIFESQV